MLRKTACGLLILQTAGAVHGAEKNVASAREGAVAIADSELAAHTGPGMAIDGKTVRHGDDPAINRWFAARTRPHPHWLWIRFRERALISKVIINRADLADYPVDFLGEYSPDGGITFFTLFTVNGLQFSKEQFKFEKSFTPKVTDNFRLRILRSSNEKQPNQCELSEVEVMGEYTGSKLDVGQPNAVSPPTNAPVLQPTSSEGLEITDRNSEVEFRSKWLRLVFSRKTGQISALCWDSLGGGKVEANLLKTNSGDGVRLFQPLLFPTKKLVAETQTHTELDGNVIRYSQVLPAGTPVRWEIRVEARAIQMRISANVPEKLVEREPASLRMAFDVSQTPVAPFANPTSQSSAPLPCLLHAADYGSLLVRASQGTSDMCLTAEPVTRPLPIWTTYFKKLAPGRESDGLYTPSAGLAEWGLDFSVESLQVPEFARQEPRLGGFARSWLNTFQYKPELGILANNTVAANAAFCMFAYTDPAVFTPTLPGGLEAIELCRESLNRYFGGAPGYGIGWEDMETDVYPSLLISAWDVVQVTGDLEWLKRWLPEIERIAAKAEAQDRDGNGLPESTCSGLSGKASRPTGNWWDLINFGHEDAYVCALSYRAFRALANLELLLGRADQATYFDQLAARIRTAYVPTFLNPKTGVLAGWKDSKGELHDYWFIFVNGLAITCGLVPDDLANKIVDRFETKLKEVEYTRFDLGLPGNLVPIAKSDYVPTVLGSPKKDDGSDTFGTFENGGASAAYAYFYIQALYQLGRRIEAERILWPMLQTFSRGGFQNGVGHGGEWRQWDGRPSGYEGFLADSYYAQMAVFTGHYGIGFGQQGFQVEKWSPLKGQSVPLGLRFRGRRVETIE
jgi:hypothetical protein